MTTQWFHGMMTLWLWILLSVRMPFLIDNSAATHGTSVLVTVLSAEVKLVCDNHC